MVRLDIIQQRFRVHDLTAATRLPRTELSTPGRTVAEVTRETRDGRATAGPVRRCASSPARVVAIAPPAPMSVHRPQHVRRRRRRRAPASRCMWRGAFPWGVCGWGGSDVGRGRLTAIARRINGAHLHCRPDQAPSPVKVSDSDQRSTSHTPVVAAYARQMPSVRHC